MDRNELNRRPVVWKHYYNYIISHYREVGRIGFVSLHRVWFQGCLLFISYNKC